MSQKYLTQFPSHIFWTLAVFTEFVEVSKVPQFNSPPTVLLAEKTRATNQLHRKMRD